MRKRYLLPVLTLAALLVAADLRAQDAPARDDSDRGIVDHTLQNVRSAVQDVLLRLSQQFGEAAVQLEPEDFYLGEEAAELQMLAVQAERLRQHIRNLRLEADQSGDTDRSRRLLRIERDLDRLVEDVQALDTPVAAQTDTADRARDGWLRPGIHREGTYRPEPSQRRTRHSTHRGRPIHVGSWVPDYLPFSERAIYNTIPALRYNRAEGFVLGIGMRPLAWESRSRARIYGQGGYAFALGDWRYQIGLETKPGMAPGDLGLKFGAEYHHNTATNDAWKAPWTENTLAAFLFKNDFFDYYDTRGWSAYAVKRITRNAQAAVAFRQDEYSSLIRNTDWALFGGDPFRPNFVIDEGDMRSIVATAEANRVAGLYSFPRGWAFRAEAEFGQGLGGDFDFNRYTAEARLYQRVDRLSGLSLRARAGYATDGAPIQKQFTLGGIGSVRAYPQNLYAGTQMLLANAEYAFDAGYLFGRIGRDAQVFLFSDGGWVGGEQRSRIVADEVLAAVGGGISLDRRRLRLELAWPVGADASPGPSLWLRLNPSF